MYICLLTEEELYSVEEITIEWGRHILMVLVKKLEPSYKYREKSEFDEAYYNTNKVINSMSNHAFRGVIVDYYKAIFFEKIGG